MRIVFIIAQLTNGGAEREMAAFANALVNMGEEVHIVGMYDVADDYAVDGRIHRHMFHRFTKWVFPGSRMLCNTWNVTTLLCKISADVIIPVYPIFDQLLGIHLAAFFSKAKVLFPVLNHLGEKYPVKKDKRKWKIQSFLADGIWIQTEGQRVFFPDYMQGKIFEVPNILDSRFLDITRAERESVRRFISAGRLHPQKNQRMMIEAFAAMIERTGDPDATLTIYGAPQPYFLPTEAMLKALIREHGLEDRVFLPGRVTDIEAKYAEADAFVFSSDYEGCPNALMEAMAAGLPCISTDCPTGPSVIVEHGKNGLLVPVKDAEAMSQAMEYLVKNPQAANAFGMAAKRRMKEWGSAEELAGRLLAQLRRICDTRTGSEKRLEAKKYSEHFVKTFARVFWRYLVRHSTEAWDNFVTYKLPLPDRMYLKWRYKKFLGKKLDLRDPRDLTAKLQWLKLYDRRPEYTQLVDKYAVKKVIADKVGEEYVIPALGVWDRFDDIDFSKLPEQFVLKCTHDSGSMVACPDKSAFNTELAREKLNLRLKRNMYRKGREWPYKHVKRRILAEAYIDSLGKETSVEYKATCFDGKVGFITICTGIAHVELDRRTNDHFDRDFNRIPFSVYYKPSKVTPEKPREWDTLIELSEKLSAGIPYVRVDWYAHRGKLYFGEMTFYTWDGFMEFEPPEYDRILGDMLTLPKEKKRGR